MVGTCVSVWDLFLVSWIVSCLRSLDNNGYRVCSIHGGKSQEWIEEVSLLKMAFSAFCDICTLFSASKQLQAAKEQREWAMNSFKEGRYGVRCGKWKGKDVFGNKANLEKKRNVESKKDKNSKNTWMVSNSVEGKHEDGTDKTIRIQNSGNKWKEDHTHRRTLLLLKFPQRWRRFRLRPDAWEAIRS